MTIQQIITDTKISGRKFVVTISGGCPTFKGAELAIDKVFDTISALGK